MTRTPDELARETIGPDEESVVADFIDFLKTTSRKRHPTGVMPRFNQGRAAGCVDAEVTVPADLPEHLRVGLFAAPATYSARIRFAHASTSSDRDADVRGMSIKVQGVSGTSLTPGATTQDFVLNSHPVMLVGTTADFLALLQAVEAGGAREAAFFVRHPRAAAIALASRRHHTSHLETSYWSTTPYLFGPGRAVKYHVRPVATTKTPLPHPLTDHYLRDRLVAQLAHGEARFELLVQFQVDAGTMPIEDASVEWDEKDSPYRVVAHIRIPPQTVGGEDADTACERMTFNPWNALIEHRPLGNFNRSRRAIYEAMAAFRAVG